MILKTIISALTISTLMSSTAAMAGKADDTARIAFGLEVSTLNYYFDSSREGLITSMQIYNGLVYRDPSSNEIKGDLAESWNWEDEKTIDFKLRQGVKFANGEPFNADDVVFTLNYIVEPANKIVVYDKVKWIKSAERLDDFTVRVHLNAPYPAALDLFSMSVPIYPGEYYRKVGASGMSVKPVGTGPYQVSAITPGSSITLEKNPLYFGGPKPAAKIAKVEVRTVRDVNTQLAELMSGNLDFMWQFPAEVAQKLKATDEFKVTSVETMRIGFITLDAMNRANPNSPMADIRVRKAMNHAINRDAIIAGLVGEGSKKIASACSPIQFGCETNVTEYNYDPVEAKKLLAEAGYPNGFTVEMGAYRDRILAEAMINDFAAVGIKINFSMMQNSALGARRMDGSMPMAYLTHGSSSIADVSAITPEFFGLGKQDYTGDKEIAGLLSAAGSTINPELRKEKYTLAFKLIADRAYWVPLWTYPSTNATSQELNFTPTSDELIRFYDMAWN